MSDTIVNFPHGLGDAVHFRLVCELYRNLGHYIFVCSPPDKEIVFGPFYTEQPGQELGWWQEDPNITSHSSWQSGNKAFRAVNLFPLPHIPATIEELSRLEVTIDVKNERQAPTDRPYITLHPQGGPGGYWHMKSLSNEQIIALVEQLLIQTDCDIILLEWHNPYPLIANDRVWVEKRPSLLNLTNLVAHACIHLDVDSGPLYLSRLTHTPAIGMVPHPFHHPVVFTLPRPNTKYISVPTPLSSLFPELYNVVESCSPLNMALVAKETVAMLS